MFPFQPHLIDLTHPMHTAMPVFPGDPECRFQPHTDIATEGYRVACLHLGTHQGTHVDAPSHFLSDGATVESLPLTQLCGPAILINLESKGSPGSTIDVPDLAAYADLILPQSRVLIYTGWDANFGQAAFFVDSPGLTPEACRWLMARQVSLVGLDLPTLHPSLFAETHVPLLSAGIVVVESINLRPLLPFADEHIHLIVAPLPLTGLDGSPVRAMAAVWARPRPGGSSAHSTVHITPVTTAHQMLDAFAIRDTVFVEEQGVDMREEHDALDREALHLLAYVDGEAVGTLRLLLNGTEATVGRFAVLKSHRGQGIGRALMEWVIAWAPTAGVTKLKLHAQTHALGFYQSCGFRAHGPEFMEAGIPHRTMERDVP